MEEILGTAYLAADGYENQLKLELKGVTEQHGRLFLTNLEPQKVFWAQNIWFNPFKAHFESITDAATILKNIQRNWAFYPYIEHRRAALIKSKLPFISEKPIQFPAKIPESGIGSWVLIDKHTLIASPTCSAVFPNGLINFEECREGPPSRAYLKLWEALTVAGKMPNPDSKCLEIGSSPGGWTWVLAKLKAQVISVDRSELAPNVVRMQGVHFIKGDAFAMTPSKVGAVDWIFSDVACYPEKLLEWVSLWLSSGLCKNFICTLKFQGDNSYDITKKFAEIPGSRVVHLGVNKHELTWILTTD